MKKINFLVIAIALILMPLINAASPITSCQLDATLLNQDPDPAQPGDYVEVVFQVSGVQNTKCNGAKFEIVPKYPFSLDKESSAMKQIYGSTFTKDYSKVWNIPYDLRVDKDALEGENTIEVKFAKGDASEGSYLSKKFNISIEDLRVDFELSVRDYNPETNEITFEILNIGEHDIDALTIEIPEQEGVTIKGTPRKIVGSLDSNEETTFDFKALPETENIELNIFYTDEINERRSLTKQVSFNPEHFPQESQGVQFSIWFYLFIILLVAIIIRYFWIKRKKKKKKQSI